jgi:long-chain acyl-CoA synthetase
LLLGHAQQQPQQVAIRQKQFGLWHTWSWHDVLEISEHYANALHGYGFKKPIDFATESAEH